MKNWYNEFGKWLGNRVSPLAVDSGGDDMKTHMGTCTHLAMPLVLRAESGLLNTLLASLHLKLVCLLLVAICLHMCACVHVCVRVRVRVCFAQIGSFLVLGA